MAQVSITGTVCQGKGGESPLTVRTFDNNDVVGNLSVLDTEYFYVKKGEDRPSQFYRVEIRGPKSVEMAQDRLVKGSKVTVHGQLIASEYNGKTYLTIKGARIQYLDPRPAAAEEDAPF